MLVGLVELLSTMHAATGKGRHNIEESGREAFPGQIYRKKDTDIKMICMGFRAGERFYPHHVDVSLNFLIL